MDSRSHQREAPTFHEVGPTGMKSVLNDQNKESLVVELEQIDISTVPVKCNETSHLYDQCFSDYDCKGGGRCCFKGCTWQCFDMQPCGRVVCEKGFVCQERKLPCDEQPCQKQANCVPLAQYRCRAQPTCSRCLAGFEPQKDQYGCNVSPCKCVPSEGVAPAPKCGSTCYNFCAYGYEMQNGCLTCRCQPEPKNPCANRDCGSNAECRFVDIPCETSRFICQPKDICVQKTNSSVDDRCSMLDSSTLGRPVLAPDMETPLNCSGDKSCPDNTICVPLGNDVSFCCWQHTQAYLYSNSPKRGQCPHQFMTRPSEFKRKCEVDGQCPGEHKCCYQNKTAGMERNEGICVEPFHKRLKSGNLCINTPFHLKVLQLLKICPEDFLELF